MVDLSAGPRFGPKLAKSKSSFLLLLCRVYRVHRVHLLSKLAQTHYQSDPELGEAKLGTNNSKNTLS